MITITESGEGKCVWCCKDAEGVTAKFRDGLSGHLCWPDFKKAVKVRSENGKPPPETDKTKQSASSAKEPIASEDSKPEKK